MGNRTFVVILKGLSLRWSAVASVAVGMLEALVAASIVGVSEVERVWVEAERLAASVAWLPWVVGGE
jgi:hypothetical protein